MLLVVSVGAGPILVLVLLVLLVERFCRDCIWLEKPGDFSTIRLNTARVNILDGRGD